MQQKEQKKQEDLAKKEELRKQKELEWQEKDRIKQEELQKKEDLKHQKELEKQQKEEESKNIAEKTSLFEKSFKKKPEPNEENISVQPSIMEEKKIEEPLTKAKQKPKTDLEELEEAIGKLDLFSGRRAANAAEESKRPMRSNAMVIGNTAMLASMFLNHEPNTFVFGIAPIISCIGPKIRPTIMPI